MLKRREDEEFEKKMRMILSEKCPGKYCWEESDQGAVTGIRAKYLKLQLLSGLDYQPYNPKFSHLSDWLKVLWCGDFDGMMRILKNLDKMEGARLIIKRETMLNMSPIFHVIMGAKQLRHEKCANHESCKKFLIQVKQQLDVKEDHIKVLQKLISLKAHVNVRDVAGYAPLHHCVTEFSDEICLQMADILLKAGADVNAQNRFGATPLLDSMLTENWDFINLLLRNGADPYIGDLRSTIPYQHYFKNDPSLMAMFEASNKARATEAGVSLKSNKCKVCGKSKDIKRCTGCYLVWYCGAQCQNGDWKDHKEDCKKITKEYKRVKVMDAIGAVPCSLLTKQEYSVKNLPKKHHFMVKLQIALADMHKNNPFLIYNEDRTLLGDLWRDGNEKVYDELMKKVRGEGIGKVRGYFRAFFDREKEELKVNPMRIQVVNTW